jgi:hypothetical protein
LTTMVVGFVTCSGSSLAMTMAPVEYAEVMVTDVWFAYITNSKDKEEAERRETRLCSSFDSM